MITWKMVEEWCKKRKATLLWMGADVFVYQSDNGMMWELPYYLM